MKFISKIKLLFAAQTWTPAETKEGILSLLQLQQLLYRSLTDTVEEVELEDIRRGQDAFFTLASQAVQFLEENKQELQTLREIAEEIHGRAMEAAATALEKEPKLRRYLS